MYCGNCGALLPENARFCEKCGAAQSDMQQQGQPPVIGKPVQNMAALPIGMTKKEFYQHPANKGWRTNILTDSVILYVCAGITLVYNIIIAQNFWGFIDILILIAAGLCIQLMQSRVAAIAVTVYGLFNMILTIILTGRYGGYLIVIAAISAIYATFKFQKSWNAYAGK